MGFTPSKYQSNIYDAFDNTSKNLVISAVAGSGKTSTLLQLLKRTHVQTTFLAFNKSIQQEIEGKIGHLPNVDVLTIHSLGIKALMKHFRKKLEVKDSKIWDFTNKLNDQWRLPKDKYAQTVSSIQTLTNIYRLTMCKSANQLCDVADELGIDYSQQEIQYTLQVIDQYAEYNQNPDVIDFTDMIYIPATNPNINFTVSPKLVFIDECQDLNACQHALIDRLISKNNARFVACGDPYQCQPKGTKISMSNGTIKLIQDVVVGDTVISYDAKRRAGFYGYYSSEKTVNTYTKAAPRITDIQHRKYCGKIIDVVTSNSTSSYTPNHRCMISFKYKQGYALYLMEKNDKCRIGIVELWGKKSDFGPTQRLRQEKGERLWILDVFVNKKQAYFKEQSISVRYNIPQIRFIDNMTGTSTQKDIDMFWQSISDIDLQSKCKQVLMLFNKDYNYPFCDTARQHRYSRSGVQECRAVNLLPDYMDMCELDFNNYIPNRSFKHNRVEFKLVNRDVIDQDIYSLSVSGLSQTYVADGILTHNSIYGFAGADSQSFDQFLNKTNVEQMPLSICYRCPTRVVDKANEVYNIVEPFEQKGPGEVRVGSVDEIEEGDMVICRNLKPLIKIYFDLLRNNKKATVRGKDLGSSLIKIIKPFEHQSVGQLLVSLASKLNFKKQELIEREIQNPTSHPSYVSLQEKIEVIEFVSHQFARTSQIIDFFENLFQDNDKKSVILSTIHKSKGLENPTVFILDKHLIPSKYATSPDQLKQENNLLYVAITRAQQRLLFIKTKNKN